MTLVQNIKQHLKTVFSLPLPDRMLKYFPPSFTLRDPVLSLVDQSRRNGNKCAVLLLKLEGALPMTETYPADCLRRLEQSIRSAIVAVLPQFFRESDIIGAKHDHDEYVLFLSTNELLDYDVIHKMSQQLRLELERRLAAVYEATWSAPFRFVVGCSFISPDIADTTTAIRSAAQYAASVAHRRLPPDFCSAHLRLLDLIREEDIRVLAQPIMNLETGEVSGWEFLTRGPQNTPFHFPDELFEYAYQADLLAKLEMLVFKKAFREMERRGLKETVFLNVTAVSLAQRSFLEVLRQTMEQFPQTEPGQVVLEITERHRIDNYAHLSDILREYRSLGFRFAVDDAGSGFASLHSISEIGPDMVKIDRSLIRDIDRITSKQVMLRTILFMAEHINCQVIAEGVERPEEANVLFEHRVRMGQGFYFAKPAPLLYEEERYQLQKLKEKIIAQRQLGSA
ncbi:EAL domain-containing protein [Paenibacillus flagellatus]|uniref:EAL domain-containing protein n=1 Tax=Paenibacillus flagellatus TaxID=2211139 RepID=A0A2V5KCS6_9BACL|nr:EAL domain-containing protein [Paenibacillus flagellatus]PYI57439.1 hypothetical protein DLM86_03105 [Paenibacillus flagellatus]